MMKSRIKNLHPIINSLEISSLSPWTTKNDQNLMEATTNLLFQNSFEKDSLCQLQAQTFSKINSNRKDKHQIKIQSSRLFSEKQSNKIKEKHSSAFKKNKTQLVLTEKSENNKRMCVPSFASVELKRKTQVFDNFGEKWLKLQNKENNERLIDILSKTRKSKRNVSSQIKVNSKISAKSNLRI